jgi:hypothetical protein
MTLTEPRAQRFRALVICRDGQEVLLYVGSTGAEIKENYTGIWNDVVDDEQQAKVHQVVLQKWNGPPDRGRWQTIERLMVPALNSLKRK